MRKRRDRSEQKAWAKQEHEDRKKNPQKRSQNKDWKEQMNVGGRQQIFNLIYCISQSVDLKNMSRGKEIKGPFKRLN